MRALSRWWSRRQSQPSPQHPSSQASAGRSLGRQQRGRASEALAAAFLRNRGYDIEAANVRFRFGELDLVAVHQYTLCIIEVRSHAVSHLGPAAGSILSRKRHHLIQAAQAYLQARRIPWDGPVRFDVVAIDYDAAGRPAIQLIANAFTADES